MPTFEPDIYGANYATRKYGYPTPNDLYTWWLELRASINNSLQMYLNVPMGKYADTRWLMHTIGFQLPDDSHISEILSDSEVEKRVSLVRDRLLSIFPIIGSAHMDNSEFDLARRIELYFRLKSLADFHVSFQRDQIEYNHNVHRML